MAKGERKEWIAKVLRRLADVFRFTEHENREVWMRYVPHAQCVLEFRQHSEDEEAERDFLFNVGESFYVIEKYKESEKMYRQSLELKESAGQRASLHT